MDTMKISYDKATDSLCIHLADRPSVDSDEVNDGVVLDFDANGALVGIDLQHASQRMDINSLSVSNMPLASCWQPEGICMSKATKTQRPLMLDPKAIKAACKRSADGAQRMADAFGQKVPVTQRKPQADQK
jgi:uncharacterized protein YuzE